MHPLDGAYVRLDRAEKHLSELKDIVITFIDDEHEIARDTFQINPEPNVAFLLKRPESPIPSVIPVLIGETAYNLRAALDYLIYQLAILDSGSIQKRTQFPLEDDPSQFQGRNKSFLKGVNAAHRAAIEGLQPYNGANWARLLRTISNPDKHCDLVIQQHQSTLSGAASPDPADVAIPADSKGVLHITSNVVFPDGGSVHVKLDITFFLSFDDGLPVIETLEEIKTQVANTLGHFKSEFK